MFRKLMTVAALAAVATTAANAQETAARPFSFGISAGAAIPTGDLADAEKTGFSVAGSVGYRFAAIKVVSFRLEGGYNQFSGKNGAPKFRNINVTGNVVYDIPLQGMVRPYLIGGVGLYNGKVSGADSENAFGFNAGAGVTLPLSGFNTFVEARFNQASKDGFKSQFVPIVFGVRF